MAPNLKILPRPLPPPVPAEPGSPPPPPLIIAVAAPSPKTVPPRRRLSKVQRERRIVFLDVDGVLHAAHHAPRSFEPRCMEALAQLVQKTKAEIVLSSSWRSWPNSLGRNAVDNALVKHGMAKTLCQTPSSMTSRAAEIETWVAQNTRVGQLLRWVVLDDMDMTRELKEHMIHTDLEIGLTQDDAYDAALKLLGLCPESAELTWDFGESSDEDLWSEGSSSEGESLSSGEF